MTRKPNRRLLKLPSGNWIAADAITAIRVLPTEEGGSGSLHRARVSVQYSTSSYEIFLANDEEHAKRMAETLAAEVNGDETSNEDYQI